jgi:hypothetical protein
MRKFSARYEWRCYRRLGLAEARAECSLQRQHRKETYWCYLWIAALAAGLLTEHDTSRLNTTLADPDLVLYCAGWVSAWGQRPPG